MECERWAHKGINITYQTREDRKGYKAGALKQGMKHGYVRECEYVVIFDADFQPNPDFLKLTVPHFKVHHLVMSIRKIILLRVSNLNGCCKLAGH